MKMLAVAGLLCLTAGVLPARAETRLNARMTFQDDGRPVTEWVSFVYEKIIWTREPGALDVMVPKDTLLARKLTEVARKKRPIASVTLEARDRDKEGKYLSWTLKNAMITSYSISGSGEVPPDVLGFRLAYKQMAKGSR